MTTADWYFDFLSPFAYLQWTQRRRLNDRLTLRPRPVLLAGLLAHWGQKGPAEIPAKRRHTYRQVQWLADRLGVTLRFPPAHPFNPLPPLRLALALDCSEPAIAAIFDSLWREGHDLEEPAHWRRLTDALGLPDAEAQIADPAVKAALRENTEQAIAAGVFGVPTLVLDGTLFWGLDSTEMALDALDHPEHFDTAEMRRLATLPVGAQRR